MSSIRPLRTFLRTAALMLALSATAYAQSRGGGPGGPGGNGPGSRSQGGLGDSLAGPSSSGAIDRSGRDGSYPPGKSPQATSKEASPSELDDYVRGPQGALDAVVANQALPLDQIVAATRHLTNGDIIDARLNVVNGSLQYEVKVLEGSGEVRRFLFDARTAQLAEVR